MICLVQYQVCIFNLRIFRGISRYLYIICELKNVCHKVITKIGRWQFIWTKNAKLQINLCKFCSVVVTSPCFYFVTNTGNLETNLLVTKKPYFLMVLLRRLNEIPCKYIFNLHVLVNPQKVSFGFVSQICWLELYWFMDYL